VCALGAGTDRRNSPWRFCRLASAAALAVFTAAVVLAFLHGCLMSLPVQQDLPSFISHLSLPQQAAASWHRRDAAILAVFHASHVVMTTCLGLRGGSRVGADGAAGVSCAQATSDRHRIKANNLNFIRILYQSYENSGVVRLTCGRRKKYQKKAKSLDAKNHSQQSGWRTRRNRGCLGSVRLRARRDEFGNFRRGDVS